MGKSSKPQNQVTKTEPWEGAKPYWQQLYGNIFGTQQPAFGGQRVLPRLQTPTYTAGFGGRTAQGPINLRGIWRPGEESIGQSGIFSAGRELGQQTPMTRTPGLLETTKFIGPTPATQQAWNMIQERATAPNQMLRGAEDYATRVLSGEFLDPAKNLAMAQNLQRGMENLGVWDTSAIQAGRYGGGAWGAGRGRQLADLGSGIYGQGLQQMTQMAGMAPSIYESGYLPSQKLLALGDLQRQIGREEQMFPWELSQLAAGMLSGAPGGSQISQYYKPNPLMGALGGGLAAGALPTAFLAANPWAIPAAAGLGYMGSK